MGSNSNNPITNIINDVLKLQNGSTFANYKQKVDALNNRIANKSPLIQELPSPQSGKKLNLTKPLVFFDLETTGLNVNTDQAFELSFLKLNPDGTINRFSEKLKPDVALSPGAAKTTGKTQAILNTYKKTFKDIAPSLSGFLEGADVAGFNIAGYDIPLLNAEFRRVGMKSPIAGANVIDVFNLSKVRHPMERGHTLSEVYQRTFGTKFSGAHTASGDVRATARIFQSMLTSTSIPDTVGGIAKISASSSSMGLIKSAADLFRLDKFTMLQGTAQYAGADIVTLGTELIGKGRLPASAANAFAAIREGGGTLYYNQSKNALYFGSTIADITDLGTAVTALPLSTGKGMVQIGESSRSARGALILGAENKAVFKGSFIDLFYDRFGAQAGSSTNLGVLSGAARRTMNENIEGIGSVRSLLGGGFTDRGINTSFEQGRALAGEYAVGFYSPENPLRLAITKYKIANAGLAMSLKTSGRMVFEELGLGKEATYKEALNAINTYRNDFFKTLPTALNQLGMLKTLPYIKPDSIVGKKMVVGDFENAMFLSKVYGTQFEDHILKKGLYQARKVAQTTNITARGMAKAGLSPLSPYVVGGAAQDGIFGTLSRVAVVDTHTLAGSMAYFGESGAYYTDTGALSLKKIYSKGTLNLANPSDNVIAAAERLFGINLANQSSGMLGNEVDVTFTRKNIRNALRFKSMQFDALSPAEQDIRTILSSNRKYRGFFNQLARTVKEGTQARISKVNLSGTSLKLDFVTPEAMTPNTVEMLMGLRRMSAGKMQAGNALVGLAQGHEFIMGVDELYKTHGPAFLMDQYIGNVMLKGEGFARKEFTDTFGNAPVSGKIRGKTFYAADIGEDFDTGFGKLLTRLESLKTQDKALYENITQGRIISTATSIPGVKEARSFFLRTSGRTDFMSDINMLKPIRMTLAKMVSLGGAGAQLGYAMGEDPLFQVFKGLSNPWRQGHLKLSSRYGQLMVGDGHWIKQFASAIASPETMTAPTRNVIKIGEKGGFIRIGKDGQEIALKSLPDISQFKYRNGGVQLAELKGTILDPSLLDSEMMYIDLGENFKTRLNLVGEGGVAKNYRYLPMPMQALRLKGSQGALTINDRSAEKEIIEDLIALEKGGASATTHGIRYSKLFRSLMGKGGAFNKTGTSVISFGTRVRLTPQISPMANITDPNVIREFFLNPEKLYEGHALKSEAYDYLNRQQTLAPKGSKGSLHNSVLQAMRESIEKNKFFYAAVGIDPTQRAEHMFIEKINIVDDISPLGKQLASLRKKGIGLLGLAMHPLLPRMIERDLDKDVANLMPLHGLSIEGKTAEQSMKLIEERYMRQSKSMRHFMLFSYAQLSSEQNKSLTDRFTKVIKGAFGSIEDNLKAFLGVPKSLGYSITRGSESVMAALIDQGITGAKQLGLLEKGFTEESILKAIAPYIDEVGETAGAVRLSVSKKLLQNVYQGAVQKGAGATKDSLLQLSEDLLEIGDTYKGAAYNESNSVEAATKAVRRFLGNTDLDDIGAKNRSLQALTYFAEDPYYSAKYPIIKESTAALQEDLIKNNGVLSDDITQKFKPLLAASLDAQAEMLGNFFGRALPIAASVQRGYRSAIGITQKILRKSITDKEVVENVISGVLGGGSSDSLYKEKLRGNLLDDERKAIAAAKEGSDSLLGSVKKFFSKGNGKFFAGLGVGAVAAAGIMSMFGGPEPMSPPPMPRDIDGRQPMDMGPNIQASAPKVYGNNQVFAASRNRSPETFSAAPRYNFGPGSDMRVTMRDKRQPMNPYLLEQQMNRVANRDFNY